MYDATADYCEKGGGGRRRAAEGGEGKNREIRGLADLYLEIGYSGWVMLELDRTREPSITASAREMKAFVTDTLKLQLYPPHH